MKHFVLFACFYIGLSNAALAGSIKVEQLELHDAWIRETPTNHPATGGYLIIENHGNTTDVLVSVSADFAIKSEIHEMKMEGDVMKMRPLENGLVIPENEQIHLKPGGYHLMFMKLKQRMIPMDVHQVTLTFKNSGSVAVPMTVHKMSHGMKHSH